MSVLASPGFNLTPSSTQTALASNYITNFDFLSQYLPDTYEKEFERYGNRSVSSFLRMVGAEMPSNSDLIKWAEQGRLHTKYVDCGSDQAAGQPTAQITISDAAVAANGEQAIRVGQTVYIYDNDGAGGNKAIVTAVASGAKTFDVAYYESTGQTFASNDTLSVFVYGSEFGKGTSGMSGSLEAEDNIFECKPIIIKDKDAVSGSDMAQIGWVEVTTENGATGYLWYLKSEHETRLRFDDYLETAMLEAVPMANTTNAALADGTDGIFHVVGTRGNLWSGANPSSLTNFDTIVQRLDKQGAIEENVLFVDRQFSFDIDDMLAAQTSYGDGGTSYGLFDNDRDMALNLGFSGFRRGYDFYKSDWKYLNDPTMRGNMSTNSGSGRINGLLVPAGSTTVYDQVLGKNAKRPFLHVRYRASETEDRRYKTWMIGSAGGAMNSDLDAMEVHFLSERACCTMGANNFFLFEQ